MATNTYTALATQVVSGSTTTSITFTGISQAYTDLRVVFTGTSDADDIFGIQVGNGTLDTGTNYGDTYLYAEWFGTGSSRDSTISSMRFGRTLGSSATKAGYLAVDFMNYSNTTTYKTALGRSVEDRSDGLGLGLTAGVSTWRSTAAINTIKIFETGGSNLRAGFTATIYGIANADIGAYATGGIITYDANYYYHTFAASGTFTPKQSLSCDVLVVAGGGGGGSRHAGGGGAGGLLGYTSQSLTATGYSITVGAGGSGGAGGGAAIAGTQGGNSQFAALTASVGGGGGGSGSGATAATTGGSGGAGGASAALEGGTGAAGTSGQGYAGGNGSGFYGFTYYAGGGGGGAGGAGQSLTDTVNSPGGYGGVGSSAYSSWLTTSGQGVNVSGTYYIAAGGGGGNAGSSTGAIGVGGNGGGGTGGHGATAGASNGSSALARTGSGGGGGGLATDGGTGGGGNGGSGLVIVRYAR